MEDIISTIAVNIIFILPMGFVGVCMIITNNVYKKATNEKLKRYGEENILKNVETATMMIYLSKVLKSPTFFTNYFVVEPGTAIIEYGEISQMYVEVTNNKRRDTTLCFNLIDGRAYSLCRNIKDEEASAYINHCFRMNNNILVGYNETNNKMHEQRLEEYNARHNL